MWSRQFVKRALLSLVVWTAVLLALFPAYLYFGPWIELRIAPVVTSFVIFRFSVDGQTGEAKMYALSTKVRSCEFVSMQWYAGSPQESLIAFDINYEGETRPVGNNMLGPWTFNYRTVRHLSNTIFGQVIYRCHPLWLTVQTVGPFNLDGLVEMESY
jgi:hypothetical protein